MFDIEIFYSVLCIYLNIERCFCTVCCKMSCVLLRNKFLTALLQSWVTNKQTKLNTKKIKHCVHGSKKISCIYKKSKKKSVWSVK